jgi:hypothetical protein
MCTKCPAPGIRFNSRSAAAPPLAAPSAPELRGPTSVTAITGASNAQPEPSGSPYALPAAAGDNAGAGTAPAG